MKNKAIIGSRSELLNNIYVETCSCDLQAYLMGNSLEILEKKLVSLLVRRNLPDMEVCRTREHFNPKPDCREAEMALYREIKRSYGFGDNH